MDQPATAGELNTTKPVKLPIIGYAGDQTFRWYLHTLSEKQQACGHPETIVQM